MWIGGHAGNVEDTAGHLVSFTEGGTTSTEPPGLSGPGQRVEASTCTVPAESPDCKGLLTGTDPVGEGGDEKLFELVVVTGSDHCCDDGTARGTRDDVGKEIGVKESLDDAEMIVGKGCATR